MDEGEREREKMREDVREDGNCSGRGAMLIQTDKVRRIKKKVKAQGKHCNTKITRHSDGNLKNRSYRRKRGKRKLRKRVKEN